MGVGAFFGHRSGSFDTSNAKLYGVELDSVSGRIAQQLYQKAKIQICGYEKADLPDSFFDLAIGNVPFGQYQVTDRQYDKLHFQIHDYFLAKTVDKLRVGGIMAFITTSGTMDKKSESVRRYLAARCDLISAVRLPIMPLPHRQVQPLPRTFCFCKSAGGSWSRTYRGFMWARLPMAFR